MYAIDHMPSVIEIGHVGENAVKPIEIDMTAWLKTMPDGVSSILCIRPGETDDDAYIAVTVMNDNVLKWTPLASDIGSVEGYGEIQIRMGAGTQVGRSVRVKTMVRSSIGSSGTLPAAQQPWVDQLIALEEAIRNNAELAVMRYYPYIDSTTETWFAWNESEQQFVDTEVPARGPQGDPPTTEQIVAAVTAWLTANITNPDSPPLDRSLTQAQAAAPADMVGDLKSAITVLPDYRFPFQKNSTLKDSQGNDISAVLRGAFKDIRIYGASASDKLSFGRIKVDASQILITVWNTAYQIVAQYSKAVSALPTGIETVTFIQSQSSGITLKAVIDWDAFTSAIDYNPLIYSRCGFAESCYSDVHDLEIGDIVNAINSTNGKLNKIQEGADSIGVYQPDASLTDSNNNDVSAFLLGAITDLYLLNAVDNEQYSIGTFVRSASDGHFQLTIWNKSYQLVCQVYIADASAYTGKKTLTLTALNNSGITGEITIDFDVVVSGTSYSQLIYRRAGFADKYVYGNLREQYLKEIAETDGGIGTHRWESKKWYAIGDSFTEQNIYPYYLNQYCGFASYYNAGQSGRGMSAMTDKLSVESLSSYDIVTVLAGTNDYGMGTPLGQITDTSQSQTFYGYCKKLIEAIIAQKPTIRIAFFTPTKRGAFENQPVYPNPNSAGFTLDQYVDAIIEVCDEYSIPCLDTFRCSQFNLLTLSALTQDSLHPNYVGGQMLARQIQGFIEAL